MSRPHRRNPAIVAAVISTIGVVVAALIGFIGSLYKEPKNAPPITTNIQEPKTENSVKTTGSQSPAVGGAKDVTVTYGHTPIKDNR